MLPACPACGRPVEMPDAATVETMPHCLRESHRAARNSGVYPLNGAPVIDGDVHDLRFLDAAPGVVIGLRAKGRARHDATGFVVRGAA